MSEPSAADHMRSRLRDAARAIAAVDDERLASRLAVVGAVMVDSYRAGGKSVFMGNGGSAAEATHLAGEMVGRYLRDRRPLPALSLTDNASSLSAIGNDYGFAEVFVRQTEALVKPPDVLIGLSTSGNSENVARALVAARRRGVSTVALTGPGGGEIGAVVDHWLEVPSGGVARVQEAHLLIGHILCEFVEAALFPDS